jgi:hypothetical protein
LAIRYAAPPVGLSEETMLNRLILWMLNRWRRPVAARGSW